MNAEVAVIDVIERILSQMLPDEWARARVVGYFADKYPATEAPVWEGEAAATPAVATTRQTPANGWGWGWSSGDGGGSWM